jgi:hypothetical protein
MIELAAFYGGASHSGVQPKQGFVLPVNKLVSTARQFAASLANNFSRVLVQQAR